MEHAGNMEHAGLLPPWLRGLWMVAFVIVAAVHLHHAWVGTGRHRYWHAGHILMAAAMAYMYLPQAAHVFPAATGVALFSAASVTALLVGVGFALRTDSFYPMWVLTTAEMAIMVYMFLPSGTRSTVLSGVLVVYLACIGVLWALGRWDRYYRLGRHAAASAPPSPAGRLTLVRTCHATMAGGMAYLLLAM